METFWWFKISTLNGSSTVQKKRSATNYVGKKQKKRLIHSQKTITEVPHATEEQRSRSAWFLATTQPTGKPNSNKWPTVRYEDK